MLIERARAKINLTLHVRGRRADGYHDLESLVVFAGCGDILALEPGAGLSLTISGPRAQGLSADADNLVLRAAHAMAERVPGLALGAFHLTKALPMAAGVGGGSADAAAALRLLARANGLDRADPRVAEAAASVGSDTLVCLESRARMMRGRGDELGAPLELPPLFALLVNPGVAIETKRAFAAMRLKPGEASSFGRHPAIEGGATFATLLPALKKGRNDMEDAAGALSAAVGATLAVIAAAPACRLARMSGSGATCFGLFETCRSAAAAAKVVRRDHPGWWVKATALR